MVYGYSVSNKTQKEVSEIMSEMIAYCGLNCNECAHCNDYPCEELKEFLSDEPVATKNLEEIRKTLQV
jgi:hypothetical protein